MSILRQSHNNHASAPALSTVPAPFTKTVVAIQFPPAQRYCVWLVQKTLFRAGDSVLTGPQGNDTAPWARSQCQKSSQHLYPKVIIHKYFNLFCCIWSYSIFQFVRKLLTKQEKKNIYSQLLKV